MTLNEKQTDHPRSGSDQSCVSCPSTRISLWVKLAYTGFVCVLVPYYLHTYGPTNFLYFWGLPGFGWKAGAAPSSQDFRRHGSDVQRAEAQ